MTATNQIQESPYKLHNAIRFVREVVEQGGKVANLYDYDSKVIAFFEEAGLKVHIPKRGAAHRHITIDWRRVNAIPEYLTPNWGKNKKSKIKRHEKRNKTKNNRS